MKQLLIVLFITFLLAGTPIHANAAPELSFDSAEVLPGQTVSLNLNFAGGTEAYAGINVTIQLPETVAINTVSKGALLTSVFTLDYSSDGNKVMIIAYSKSSTFSGSGTLFTLSVKADDDALSGEQDVIFVTDSSGLINPNALSNSDGSKSVSPTLNNGKIVISKLEDDDGDGLSDEWEMKYFGNLNQGANGDPDEDGHTNLQEYQYGTNPTKSGDVDGNKTLNLKDAIIALRIACGKSPSEQPVQVNMAGDVNGDGQIGIHEAIFVLDQLSRITD
ncbi:hypothetical protein [Desulfonema magnum]|uniref:Cohesin domain-containing protein n=1 Tax=Desulfonema magnum TaxID=45655 RepID=A0A975BT32_9BACT|nr:hypothetical protein [Desulfonema magnum]QTA90595.1 Cohesin domain-containing protein [Desulfonema magnum]